MKTLPLIPWLLLATAAVAAEPNLDAPVPDPITCKTFKKIPRALEHSTLFENQCLEIEDDTDLKLEGNPSLGLTIIATSELRIGKNVKLNGHGMTGKAGEDRSNARSPYPHCPGDKCLCPGPSDRPERLYGGRGEKGFTGAAVRIVARKITFTSKEPKFTIDVTGGEGGQPGGSGRQDCGPEHCHKQSDPCPGPDTKQGETGEPGSAFVVLGDAQGRPVLNYMRTAIKPSPAKDDLLIKATDADFENAVREARRAARHYDSFPGE